MSTRATLSQRAQLALETRKRFVAEAGLAMGELGAAVQERLTTLMNEPAPSREMQSRRDAWTLYQRIRAPWVNGVLQAWQTALVPPVSAPKRSLDEGFELVGTEVVENR